MKLTTRFLILTGILGLAVMVSLGVAYWGVATVDNEVRTTYGEVNGILARVELIKRNFEWQTQALKEEEVRLRLFANSRGPEDRIPGDLLTSADALDLVSMARRSESSIAEVRVLRDEPGFRRYVQTLANIEQRVVPLAGLVDDCIHAYEAGDVQGYFRAVEAVSEPFERLHLMIEQLEGRLLEDISLSLENATAIRNQVYLILLGSLIIATLVIALVWLLQRRWFNRPIRALREAAIELSHGNFEHRIPIHTRDELGQLSEEVNEMAGTIVQIQQKLVERERLAAVGEMMRRIVHNLRNPLAGIRSLAELTRSELPSDSDERENQDRILTTVDRFERWLEDVLHTTRPMEVRLEPGIPGQFIRSVIEPQLATAKGKAVALEVNVDDAPIEASFDGRHLQHAIVALVANAIEACPTNGTVRVIGTSLSEEGSGNGQLSEARRHQWQLIIEDSGSGVDSDLRNRIFEPYFTTKRHGSGIGLAVVRNVVQAHGGEITVDRSELGGARFVITLPC